MPRYGGMLQDIFHKRNTTMQDNKLDRQIQREQAIIRTSIIGVIVNILLSAFKAVVGLLSNSIAITLDAVNNLSDALSSVVTIIGTKLAGKMPDREHPLGHGRMEYLSSLLVSAIILYAGFISLTESVKKIISPEQPDYSTVSLIIVSVAIATKILLGSFVKRQGKKVGSSALVASGADAAFDALLSASVLASAIIYIIWHISLEPFVGILISAFIIKAGIEMVKETLDDILGKRADSNLSKKVRQLIAEEPEVRGAYDLIIHNYGPDKNYASVHLELPDTMCVNQVDLLTRRIEAKVYKATGVVMTGVGVYSYNTSDDETARIRNQVQEIVMSYDWVLQMHGFYADTEKKMLRFDAVLSFDVRSYEDAVRTICERLHSVLPGYDIQIVPDIDVSD